MLTKFEFHNVDGAHTFAFNDVTSPLNTLDVTVDPRVNTDRAKMEQHGINPTKSKRGGMSIHIEGAMFKDTTDNYVAYRKTLALALFGVPTDLVVFDDERKLGTLIVRFDGETEDWETDCTITAYTNPIKGLYPTLSEFAVTFFSWTPWFTGVTSSNYYYWS